MKLEVWFTGKTWEPFVREGMALYVKRLRPLLPVEVVEWKDAGQSADAPAREAREVLRRLQPADQLILLDERGSGYDSRQFAAFLQSRIERGGGRLVFLAGGAYGFDPAIRERSAASVSLSPMTFNHQLVRVVFLEQLYRAATILQGHPYHHD